MVKEKIDIITLQLINNFLYSVVDEMTQATIRTSLSPIMRDAFDFQCGLCLPNGEILLEGEGSLVHTGVYPILINDLLTTGTTVYPGDIFINNDPYSNAGHLPDMYMYQPIFLDNELVGWSVAVGHVRDIGGSTPGSCACNSREIYQEGLRMPPTKLYQEGIPNETLFRLLRANSRVPEILIGDIEAFRSACHIGEIRFLALLKTYGWKFLSTYLNELLDYAERLTRAEIRKLPNGEYEFTDYLDDDGRNSDPIPVHVKLTVDDDEITLDSTGTGSQVEGAMNNPVGNTKATVVTTLRYMLDPDIPRNSGAFRPVKFILPEGTLLNPRLPAACSSRAGTIGRFVDAMLGAMAKIAPDKIMACNSEADVLLNIGGYDQNDKPWILMEAIWGGWGGRPSADGVDYNTPTWLNGGNIPCESQEEIFPVLCTKYGYLPDREGAGKYRGSVALIREYKLLDEQAILQLRTERQLFPPYGLYGGQPGASEEVIINPDTENRHLGKTTMDMKKNDVLRIITSGAGGWGDPIERDPEMVLKDVCDEKVSAKRALETYGVVIDKATMKVDIVETQRRRRTVK